MLYIYFSHTIYILRRPHFDSNELASGPDELQALNDYSNETGIDIEFVSKSVKDDLPQKKEILINNITIR